MSTATPHVATPATQHAPAPDALGAADAVTTAETTTTGHAHRHGDAGERTISLLCMALFDIGLTLLLYNTARANGVSEFGSYLLSMIGPFVSIAVEFIRHRRLSMFSVFILSVQALAALITFIGSTDPKVLILKDSALTGGIGLIFLASTLVAKPVTYYFGQKFGTDGSPEAAAEWERMWREYPGFRKTQRVVGVAWGIGFLVEALIRVVAVYTLPFDTAFNLGALLPLVVLGLLMTWTFWYSMRARRAGERRAAEQRARESAAAARP